MFLIKGLPVLEHEFWNELGNDLKSELQVAAQKTYGQTWTIDIGGKIYKTKQMPTKKIIHHLQKNAPHLSHVAQNSTVIIFSTNHE